MKSGSFWKTAVIFFVIVFAILVVYAMWNVYFGTPDNYIDINKSYENYLKLEEKIKELQRADTYGGRTPQETLDLFIEALRAEDIVLAAKYFAIDLNEQEYNKDYYLTKKRWEDGLRQSKEEGKLDEIADTLARAKPTGSPLGGRFGFEVRDSNGAVAANVDMRFNEESGVWKIESM